MSQLPDGRPTDVGQPYPFTVVQPAAVELYGERRVAYVQSADNPNVSVAIDARLLQPPAVYQPRDLTPQPLLDPVAQRMLGAGLGGGVFAAGAGYGVGQIISAAAGGLSGLIALAAILVVARITAPRSTTHIEQTVHHHNRWFGRSTTNL